MPPSREGPGEAEDKQLKMEAWKDVAAKKTNFVSETENTEPHCRMLQSPLSTDVINP